MTPSVTGTLVTDPADAEVPPQAVVVAARHDPPWATAAAVEEALLGPERLQRAAHRLRATVHELRLGVASEEARWRERWRRAAPGTPVVITGCEDLDHETVGLLQRAAVGLGHEVFLRFGHLPRRGPSRQLAESLGVRAPAPASVRLPASTGVRLVLRAAATLGATFEVADLAARLGRPVVRVLEELQRAVDEGFPLADHGGGRLSMPEEARWALAEGVLPSLHEAWAARPVADDEPVLAAPPPQPEPAVDPEPEAASPGDDVPDGADEAAGRLRAASEGVAEPSDDPRQQGLAQLELARSLRARPGLGVRLTEAIEAARQAVDLLADAQVHELATAQVTLAHLLVEHGAPDSLDEALELVVAASRGLASSGEAEAAASLLNDQAEVWLKLGDPVRAAHLLDAAEDGLAGREDALANIERAETDHLLARLPLYAAAREGRQADALHAAMKRLDRAEAVYAQVGWADRQAHALDTRGRLLERLGQVEQAVVAMQQSAALYRRLGDGLGLARVTEGLASLWAHQGQPRRAVALLEQSTVLNLAAASPAGLAYVRRAAEQLPQGPHRAQLEQRLAEAEVVVGRVELPPAPGSR